MDDEPPQPKPVRPPKPLHPFFAKSAIVPTQTAVPKIIDVEEEFTEGSFVWCQASIPTTWICRKNPPLLFPLSHQMLEFLSASKPSRRVFVWGKVSYMAWVDLSKIYEVTQPLLKRKSFSVSKLLINLKDSPQRIRTPWKKKLDPAWSRFASKRVLHSRL